MSSVALEAVATVLALVLVSTCQVVGLRPSGRVPRWLSVPTALAVVAFVVAMGARLGTAL